MYVPLYTLVVDVLLFLFAACIPSSLVAVVQHTMGAAWCRAGVLLFGMGAVAGLFLRIWTRE